MRRSLFIFHRCFRPSKPVQVSDGGNISACMAHHHGEEMPLDHMVEWMIRFRAKTAAMHSKIINNALRCCCRNDVLLRYVASMNVLF